MRRITPQGQDLGLLYFTSQSLTDDDKRMFLIGQRRGIRNLYSMNVDGSQLKQLTDIPDNNNPDTFASLHHPPVYSGGFEKDNIFGEPAMDSTRGFIYYLRGRHLMKTSLDGHSFTLALLPKGSVCAVLHVSTSGRKLLVATTDQGIFEGCTGHGFDAGIDERVQTLGFSSVLRVYDTNTGDQILRENVPRAWITHVQFHPDNDGLILYNHEWPSDCGVRRVWLFDGQQHHMVRPQGQGRSAQDWTCHEMWSRSGRSLIYHGTYHKGPSYLGRALIHSAHDVLPIQLSEIPLSQDYVSYGHFTVGLKDELYTDGYFRHPGEGADKSRYISRVDPDWEKKSLVWTPLCEHRSSFTTQDSHPHPVLNHKGDTLYFNSDFEGHRAVYALAL